MNKLMSKLSPSATRLIRGDHAYVMAQFHKVQPGASRLVSDAAVRNLCNALEVHATLEEELFYPALHGAGVALPQLDQALPEHRQMRELIQRLRGAGDDEQTRRAPLHELLRIVMHHVAEEESVLLPAAEHHLSHEALCEIGARWTARKMQLAKPHLGEMAADMARASPAKTALLVAGAVVGLGALLAGSQRHQVVERRIGLADRRAAH